MYPFNACIYPIPDLVYPLHNPTAVSYIISYQQIKGPRFIMLIFGMKLCKCIAVLFDYAGVVILMFLWTYCSITVKCSAFVTVYAVKANC